MSRYICQICGFVYNEAKGIPDKGVAPGTLWEQLPDNWKCPLCGAPKSQFKKEAAPVEPSEKAAPAAAAQPQVETEELRELSDGELAALCSNLARGCEKQYKADESALFTQLAEFYTARVKPQKSELNEIGARIADELSAAYPAANSAAGQAADRGAKRVLVWSEKVSRMTASILERYEKEGDAMLENTRVWVCDICGFIYIGDTPPAICPICKVPSFKILEVARA